MIPLCDQWRGKCPAREGHCNESQSAKDRNRHCCNKQRLEEYQQDPSRAIPRSFRWCWKVERPNS